MFSEPEIPWLLFRMPRFRDWAADVFREASFSIKRDFWELCSIERTVYLHLGHILPTNVTVWKQYSHSWSIPNISLTLPSEVSLTRRFATSSSLYDHLKRQMTRFEWFYHLKTKSQQILWRNNLRIWAHTTIELVFVRRTRTRTKCEGNRATDCRSAVCCLSFSMWPVWCRLCRLHTRTFT